MSATPIEVIEERIAELVAECARCEVVQVRSDKLLELIQLGVDRGRKLAEVERERDELKAMLLPDPDSGNDSTHQQAGAWVEVYTTLARLGLHRFMSLRKSGVGRAREFIEHMESELTALRLRWGELCEVVYELLGLDPDGDPEIRKAAFARARAALTDPSPQQQEQSQ